MTGSPMEQFFCRALWLYIGKTESLRSHQRHTSKSLSTPASAEIALYESRMDLQQERFEFFLARKKRGSLRNVIRHWLCHSALCF